MYYCTTAVTQSLRGILDAPRLAAGVHHPPCDTDLVGERSPFGRQDKAVVLPCHNYSL